MIEDLVDVVDRNWTSLQKQSGIDFALACFPFVEQLQRDSRIVLLLEDLRSENRQSGARLAVSLEAARRDTLAVFQELQASRPELIPRIPDPQGYDRTAQGILRPLQAPVPDFNIDVLMFAEEIPVIGFDASLLILKGLLEETDLEDLKLRQAAINDRVEQAKRARRIYYRTDAGAAFARVERDLYDLHPPVTDQEASASSPQIRRLPNPPMWTLRNMIFGRRHIRDDSEEMAAMQRRLDELRIDMERVHNEVRRRLGMERSLLAVVNRYQQRCQWYDAEKLRALAEKGAGRPEDRLSETLVTYLFDHGLNPLTEPLLGKLRPDIHHSHSKFSFYVEVKQYIRGCRGYLLQGIQEMWSMLDNIGSSPFDIQEAFYVVYRRGGPSYSFPPFVPHRNRKIYIVMVDIAPTSRRGSRAPRTIAFDIKDLLPPRAVGLEVGVR